MKLELTTEKSTDNLSRAIENVLRVWSKGVIEVRYATFVTYREYEIPKDRKDLEIYYVTSGLVKKPRVGTRVTVCKDSGEGLLSPFAPYKGPNSIVIEYTSDTTLLLEWEDPSVKEVVEAIEKAVRVSFSSRETLNHIGQVKENLGIVSFELGRRGDKHDASKLEPPEAELFCAHTHRLRDLTYGSPEYLDNLKDLAPALEHHYKMNPHHPEHWGTLGVKGMSLLDLIEMLADWYAVTKRHADGDLRKSIEINHKRFDMSDDLTNLLTITAERLGWLK
jgi:hypothetical protein